MKRLSLLTITLFMVGALTGCIPKMSLTIVPDGKGGYLRSYITNEGDKKPHPALGAMGVEHCKREGSEIKCRDLKVTVSQ